MDPEAKPARGVRALLLPLLSLAIGTASALIFGEVLFRVLGLKEPGRIFRISNGADLQFPGRAGHTVIDLYNSNPRNTFPVDLNDPATRTRLINAKFARVEEAWRINPYGIPFVYNSRGFREREFAPKPKGLRRIAFVGDSFTEAQGVVETATAVRLVEDSLGRSGDAVEAWNLGVRGHDFPDLETIFNTALELSPDAVILEMVLNDADRGRELTDQWPRVNDWIMVRPESPSWLRRNSYLVGFLTSRYESALVSRDTTGWYRALYSDGNKDGWMRTRAALQRMRAACRDRGIGFGVALWPLLVGLDQGTTYPFEAAHAQIRKGVERASIPFLDLLTVLKGHESGSLWVHSSDLHPNERAQALVAPALADFARKRLEEAENAPAVAK